MKIKRLIIILMLLIMVGVVISICVRNKDENVAELVEEITPEEEISEEQERKTMITLYFEDKETGELSKEARCIDAKILASNPYEELMKMLIEGPEIQNLQSVIPEGTKINGIDIKGDTVYIDLSKEFIDNHKGGIENESKTIYSIVNTLTELNEVSFGRILIDGQENLEFKDGCMNFKENFERND